MKTLMDERELLLPIPAAFAELAQESDMEVQQLLQELAGALSVYAHLAPKDDSPQAAAMVLLEQWLQQRDKREEQLRPLHVTFVNELLCLSRSPLSPAQRLHEGRTLVTMWKKAMRPAIATGTLQRITLQLPPDVYVLQHLFHFALEEFLIFYMQCITLPPESDAVDDNRQLALHFFLLSEP